MTKQGLALNAPLVTALWGGLAGRNYTESAKDAANADVGRVLFASNRITPLFSAFSAFSASSAVIPNWRRATDVPTGLPIAPPSLNARHDFPTFPRFPRSGSDPLIQFWN